MSKPVVAYIAGFEAPPGKTMGHAGAIISGTAGTAQAKKEALEARGIAVGTNPTEAARLASRARLRTMGGSATRSRLVAVAVACTIAATCAQTPASAASRVEVVVSLSAPSLVTFAHGQRTLQGYGHAHRVLASAFGSRMYLARLRSKQALAARRIEREVPGARVRRHYLTVLDGLSVLLRPAEVRALRRVSGVTAVYPNLRYHALSDTVPEVIGAPGVWGSDLAGAGVGVKVGVIDDGIDQHHPFFAPRGLVAPPGFPKGKRAYTTGKVIVARAFAAAGASRRDRLPFDPSVSRHGTHVAGILAGDNGLIAPGESGRPTVGGPDDVAGDRRRLHARARRRAAAAAAHRAACGTRIRARGAPTPRVVITTESRKHLRPDVPRADAVYSLQRTALLVLALVNGDLDALPRALDDRLHQPDRSVLTPMFCSIQEHLGSSRDGCTLWVRDRARSCGWRPRRRTRSPLASRHCSPTRTCWRSPPSRAAR